MAMKKNLSKIMDNIADNTNQHLPDNNHIYKSLSSLVLWPLLRWLRPIYVRWQCVIAQINSTSRACFSFVWNFAFYCFLQHSGHLMFALCIIKRSSC